MKAMWVDKLQRSAPRLLLAGFIVELINLFSIAVTQGLLQFPVFSDNRFVSFGVHAFLAWLLFLAYSVFRFRAAEGQLKRLRVAQLAVLAVCLFGTRIYFEHGIRLSADSPHYFVQARSLLFDGDLDFDNDYQQVRAQAAIAQRYPVGMPILSLPFLLAAHWLLIAGRALGHTLDASGFGYPYETAFGLAGCLFGTLGLLRVLRTVSRFFSVGMATLSLLTLWASSFLLWYMMLEPAMPHAMSFAWTSFFLCFWLERRPFTSNLDWLLLGVLVGVAALVRWQNGVLILLPILDHVLDSRKSLAGAAWALLAAAVCFSPQLLFWQITAGVPLAIPFDGHGVSWNQLSVLEVLYSTNRGLFPWNPIFYLGFIGLVLWALKSRRLGALFFFGFLLQIFINSNVAIWWSGWSFGGRRFDSCVLFFVVGVAELFQFLRRKPLVIVGAGSAFLCLWSFGLMKQALLGEIPPDRLVSFRSVSMNNVNDYYEKLGFPFAAPLNWLFGWRFDVPPEKFDRLYGHEGFGNLRLRFGRESEAYVGRGWGDAEPDPRGNWFRWTTGSHCTLLVPLKQPRDYLLTAQVTPYRPNRIRLQVNGRSLAERVLSEGGVLSWRIGTSFWHSGINELRFEIAGTARLSEEGRSSDSRELGVRFYNLELISQSER